MTKHNYSLWIANHVCKKRSPKAAGALSAVFHKMKWFPATYHLKGNVKDLAFSTLWLIENDLSDNILLD